MATRNMSKKAIQQGLGTIRAHHAKGVAQGWCIQCRFPWFDGMCECGHWDEAQNNPIAKIGHKMGHRAGWEAKDRLYLLECELRGVDPLLAPPLFEGLDGRQQSALIHAHYQQGVAQGWCEACLFPWCDGDCECGHSKEVPEYIARLGHKLNDRDPYLLYLLTCSLKGETPCAPPPQVLLDPGFLDEPVLDQTPKELEALWSFKNPPEEEEGQGYDWLHAPGK